MAWTLITKLDRIVNNLLDYEGCDNKMLNARKTIWLSTVFGLMHVVLITPVFLLFMPHLKIISYGFFLITLMSLSLLITPKLRKSFAAFINVQQVISLLATFYIIFIQGGIATSFGLIFACLAFILLTIPLQNIRITIFLFILFSVLVIVVSAFAQEPKDPEQMLSPKWNSIIFAVNTLSMSALSLYFVVQFIIKQQKYEQLESNKLREINEAKTKLFTGITHEFRTPLTVIKGMTDLIEHEPNEWINEGTTKIKNNCNILLNLVNQMLDMAKIETGVMPLHFIQTDINAYIGYVAELFKSAAHSKNIKIEFQNTGQPFVMDFDPDKLLHILSNLISNALKFTPEGGRITLASKSENNESLYTIQVTDNGSGIHPENLHHIFDRFYQVEQEIHNKQGSGLGLALAKEFTELLNGKISVESELGNGSNFTVTLPVSNKAEIRDYLSSKIMEGNEVPFLTGIKISSPITEHEFMLNKNLPSLLIVEDSSDVSLYLKAILKAEYHIEVAENGKVGLEKALNLIPDIILCDVMMPEMDGIEMLEKIKTDFRTSHIPVVMLTAKADIDSRLIGLERGADAYLAKPFNQNELHIQLRNLIDQRKKLHERYASLNQLPETQDLAIKTEDAFMIKVRQILENNLDNEDYNIHDLCQELAVSHAQLYRKFKSISNKTIADYFKLLRLHKAKQLLSKAELNITQIAFAVGFKNLSHFSREFTLQFGKSPKELRKDKN